MENKLILFAIGMFLLVGTVSAISVGDILTQNQVNGINFDTANLNCSFNGGQIVLGEMAIRLNFDCMSLMKQDDGNYLVIERNWDEDYSLFSYVQCRVGSSKAVCLGQAKTFFLDFFQRYKLLIRSDLKKYQTSSDITSGDITFTEGDLN